MDKNCYTCKHVSTYADHEDFCMYCEGQPGKEPSKWDPVEWWKPDTNADCIRSMSDIELAKLLAPKGCPPVFGNCATMTCRECWINWLQMPAEVQQ